MRTTVKKLILYLSSVALCAQAVQYQVISLVNNDVSMAVVVDGKPYPLTPSVDSSIVHTGEAPKAKHKYFYAKTSGSSILEREPFARKPAKKLETTPYQFYNRSRDSWDVPSLPQVYDRISDRIDTDLHLDGQIGTIHITGDVDGIAEMHHKVFDEVKVPVNISFIRENDFLTFDNSEIELSGHSTRWLPKLSYNIKIDKKAGKLYGYRRLKLRSLYSDPSYIREAMVFKTLKAAGVPTTDVSFVRVFINDKPAGLFGLVEVFKNPWVQNEFDNGNKDYKQGNLYQAMRMGSTIPNIYSDLSYYENHTWYLDGQYKIKEDPSKGEPSMEPLIDLTRFTSVAGKYDVDEWEKHFVIESLLRSLALEVLLGFSDGFIAFSNNYYLYQNGQDSKQFYFIPSDVDLTMGSTLVKLEDMLSGNYSAFPGLDIHPFMTQLLQVPALKNRLESLLKNFSQRLLSPKKFFPMLDATVNMVRQDVEWDQSLARLSTHVWDLPFEDIMESALAGPYPKDNATVRDLARRGDIPFEVAVNGPTGHISSSGVKEFITKSNRAIKRFYKLK